jgi:hypothetical protein
MVSQDAIYGFKFSMPCRLQQHMHQSDEQLLLHIARQASTALLHVLYMRTSAH